MARTRTVILRPSKPLLHVLPKKRSKPAFTLIELVVVISVIAILAAILLPALARAKSQARTVYCLNNKRQLAVAWLMYAQDSRDYLAYNTDPVWGLDDMDAPNWVASLVDWSTASDCSNLALLTNDTNSSMAPYISHVAAPYHCPEDTFLSPQQRAEGWTQRARSVSMNYVMGDGLGATGEPKSHAGFAYYASAQTHPPYISRWFIRIADLAGIGPSMACVFLDEHPDSLWLSPSFEVQYKPGVVVWRQLPASYHSGGCTLSFADGHEEYKKWVVPQTTVPVHYTYWDYAFSPWDWTSDTRDWEWFARHSLEPSAFP
ncbi:MAG TPA: prepilin-type N-terminal cleavage/methylation domain-containing protein [Candidatus Baltobacteraceae bacterium]|nr:prepilin-type N-terminal cleavage/methylation domain-containing protein [Candidatus Baltobacteraceae bacterium]